MADLSDTFVREIEISSSTLSIHQAFVGDVGCVVWDAALVLAKYLEKTRWNNLKNKKILELGAGTGIVGLSCCLAGADVVCTDLKELLSLIGLNMKMNKTLLNGKFEYCELKWGENLKSFHPVDCLVMSDVIYYEEFKAMWDDPYWTSRKKCSELIEQSNSNENTEVLVSYEERYDGNKPLLKQQLFEILEENFVIHKIPLEEQDSLFQSSDIHIVSMRRKQQT